MSSRDHKMDWVTNVDAAFSDPTFFGTALLVETTAPADVDFSVTSTPSISEDSAETATFTVSLKGDPLTGSNTASVDIAVSGTATSGTDYSDFIAAINTAASAATGVTFDGVDTLTFDSSFNGGTGTGDFTFTVTAVDDPAVEGSETIVATLSNPTVDSGTATINAGGVISFQEGVSGYAGTQDTQLNQGSPDSNFGTAEDLVVDQSSGGGIIDGLIRFDSLFGGGADEIPSGAIIDDVTLTFRGTGATGDTVSLHRMLVDWNEATATWNSFGPNLGLVSGTDYSATVDSSILGPGTGDISYTGANLVATLQAWSDGASNNYGWAIIISDADGWDFASSESTTDPHPVLQVTWHLATPGTATTTITETDTNTDPVITSDGGGATASVNVAENTTTVTTVTATDAEGDPLTFSLSGGTDQAFFSIDSNSGLLTFDAAPDFETPADGNGDNVYEVEVTVSDGNSGTDTQLISVTVTDANDPPTAADNTVTTNEDTVYTFAPADFNFSDQDAGDTLQWITIESLPAAGSLELSGVAVTVGQQISFADIDVGNLTFTPVAEANGTGYASFDFTVNDGTVPAFENSVAGNTVDGTSTLTLPPISGGTDQLYVVVVSMRADQTVTSISGGGLTWTKQIEQQGGRGTTDFVMYTAYGSPADFQVSITTDTVEPVAAIVGRYSGTDGIIYATRVSNTNGQADGPGTDLLASTGGLDDDTPVLDIDPGAANRIVINGLNSRMSDIAVTIRMQTRAAVAIG
jgi:hypothetical protein